MSDDATQLNNDRFLQETSQVRREGSLPSHRVCDDALLGFADDCVVELGQRMRTELQNFHLPNYLARCSMRSPQSALDQRRLLHKRFASADCRPPQLKHSLG